MNRSGLALKGSAIGITSQIVNLIAKFIVRTFAIRILGKEILGLDSVLIDTISMLSLAEMGITSAMLYRLYAPIINKDQKRIDEWMATYRIIYHVIAGIVAIMGVVISFALPLIIREISVPWSTIYIAFYLQLAGSVSSYLLAYKRILLNADQKKHICLLVDLLATVVFSVAKIIVIILLRSYEFYLIMTVLQTIISNIILHVYSNKIYPFVARKTKAKRDDLHLILKDTKEVLANKLATYIYSSTDNLIISIFLGTGIVGLLSNYKYISLALRSTVNSAMTTIQPLIGNYLNSTTSKAESYRTLKRYTFVRYIIAGATSVPFIVLANTFVLLWTGDEKYLMASTITIFLALDYYIGCVYGPLGEYILGMGMFKQGKYATFAGALTNIVLSLIGAKEWGCDGVLFATVISQLVIWAGDTYIIMFKYYKNQSEFKWDYIKTQLYYIAIFAVSIVISGFAVSGVALTNLWAMLFIGIAISEIVFFSLVVITTSRNDEFAYAKGLIVKALRKIKRA